MRVRLTLEAAQTSTVALLGLDRGKKIGASRCSPGLAMASRGPKGRSDRAPPRRAHGVLKEGAEALAKIAASCGRRNRGAARVGDGRSHDRG